MTFKKLSLGFSALGKDRIFILGLKEEKELMRLCLMKYVDMNE
jgi:hypothetical protein